jgi:hypothetical protein
MAARARAALLVLVAASAVAGVVWVVSFAIWRGEGPIGGSEARLELGGAPPQARTPQLRSRAGRPSVPASPPAESASLLEVTSTVGQMLLGGPVTAVASLPGMGPRAVRMHLPGIAPTQGHATRFPLAYARKSGPDAALAMHAAWLSIGETAADSESTRWYETHEELVVVLVGTLRYQEVARVGGDEPAPARDVTAGGLLYHPGGSSRTLTAVSPGGALYVCIRWLGKKAVTSRAGRGKGRAAAATQKPLPATLARLQRPPPPAAVTDKPTHVIALDGPTSYLRKLRARTTVLLPGAAYPAHTHAYDLVTIVLAGRVRTVTGDGHVEAGTGASVAADSSSSAGDNIGSEGGSGSGSSADAGVDLGPEPWNGWRMRSGELGPLSVELLPAGVPHALVNDGAEEAYYVSVGLHPRAQPKSRGK